MRRVCMLLGKPPERSPVLPDVVACLELRGATVHVHVPRADDRLPAGLLDHDVVALRGLRPGTLTRIVALEREHGLRCCNTARATLLADDRSAVHRRLAGAGLPVPAATSVAGAAGARVWAAGRAVVVKADGPGRRGARQVVLWERPDTDEAPAVPGPWLVQEWVPCDGVDRKLYVGGHRIAGLLKQLGPVGPGRRTGTVFDPDPRLQGLARAVGRVLDLCIYGVDVVQGPDGPIVVDVNAFPSFNGVPGAAEMLADTLLVTADAPAPAAVRSRCRGAGRFDGLR